MDTDKVSAVVAEFFKTLESEPQPVLRIAKLVDTLRSRPGWSESEILEVHARLFVLVRRGPG